MEAQLDQAFQLVVEHDTQAIKRGEQLLQQLQKNSEYPIALLHYVNNPATMKQRKLNAAIQLKLWCNTYKNLQQFQRQYYGHLINDITKGILVVYLTFALKILSNKREGIVSLAEEGIVSLAEEGIVSLAYVHFPKDWNDLLSNLLAYANQTPSGIAVVLKLIQSISNKYRYESRSDPLYQEIIFVCNQLHDFLLVLTQNILSRVQQSQNNVNEVQILEILMKIFYNLNYQDLHPKFEDNLGNWMNILKQVMNIQNTNQKIFKCKGAALQAILLYASKYKEDVEEPIKGFCQQIWNLCATASEDSQYDQIVFNCLKFFKSLMMWPQMKGFFNTHMSSLFQNLVLPNIGITRTMIELFEDQIDLFIDYYFRNTELQTRRAAALEILRVICRHYQSFSPFLEQQLHNFQGEIGNIESLCTILNFTIDGSSKGFRDVDGCTQLFVNQNIIDYTYQNIAKKSLFQLYDWMTRNEQSLIESKFDKENKLYKIHIIHITILLRFLFYFRIFIPRDQLVSIVKFLTSIKTQIKQLRKVIYLTLNGFLIMKHGDFNYYKNMETFFVGDRVENITADVLKVIYDGTIYQEQLQLSLTKMFYNITRAMAAINDKFFQMTFPIIKEMLKRTAIYDFETVQFCFEGIGFVVYWLIKTNGHHKSELEAEMTNFLFISLNNKSDLLNFCLQILAVFLQLQPTTNQQYKNIYESLLLTQNWKQQNQSLMSSYIQFLISYISKFKERLIQDKTSIEVILSKIIEIDHIDLFYRFLEAIMLNTSLMEFCDSGYLMLTLQGGQVVSKSIAGKKASLIFICKLTLNYDIVQLLQLINRCFNRYYDQLLEASFDIVKSLSNRAERKYLFSSICRAIKANYFSDHRFVGLLINNLIYNTAQKYNFRNLQSIITESQAKEKKESTYKKLIVFKQFEIQQKQIMIDEEQQLVETCKHIQNIDSSIIDMLDSKNKDRLGKMHQKYSN